MRYGRSREEALAWIEHTDEPNAVRIEATASRADFRFSLQPSHALPLEMGGCNPLR